MQRANHHSLLQPSGRLIKYFFVGVFTLAVTVIFFGSLGATALVASIFQTMLPLIAKGFVGVFCFAFLAIVLESFH